jgi:multisubunit Na+/H+ antiporter MnhE subunit
MRAPLRVVVAWLALTGLWMLYVGQATAENAVAGAIAAAVATAVGVLLGRLGLLRFGLHPGRHVRAVTALPWHVIRDFVLITLALARGRPRGRFVELDFPQGSAGDRALAGLLSSVAPNAYVVDFDRDRNVVVVHELL